MVLIDDDPVLHSIERWGWPPWLLSGGAYEDDEQEEDEDAKQKRELE